MIYIIECELTGLIKVGFSKTRGGVNRRLRQYRVHCPGKTRLVHVRDGGVEHEHDMHGLLHEFHYRNEWFRCDVSTALAAASHPQLGALFATAREAAERLGLSHGSIMAKVTKGQVPGGHVSINTGRSRRCFVPRSWLSSATRDAIQERRSLTWKDWEGVAADYESGLPIRDIMQKWRIASTTVNSCVRRLGKRADVRKRGEAHGQSRLTDDIVRQVRRARDDGATFDAIGRRFGISDTLASRICKRKSWAHVA